MKQALIIGIDKYLKEPLTGCVNDATQVANALKYNGDGTLNFEVKTALNTPTKGELRGMIRNLFNRDADMVLLYFAGHGYIDETGGYIVTPDGEENDPGILMDEILQCASQSDVKTKIIILDCCSSGSFGAPAILNQQLGTPAISSSAFLRKGMSILTSSRSNEPSQELINGHGLFTGLLLDALNGGGADLKGDITPGSIYAYIDMAIGNWGQRPVFRTNVTRFSPVKKVKPSIDPEVLKRIVLHFTSPNDECALDPSFEWTQPTAIKENTERFGDLQKMNRVGLVVPHGAEPNDMYWAAIQSKNCGLTALGKHYWGLVKDNRF